MSATKAKVILLEPGITGNPMDNEDAKPESVSDMAILQQL